MRLIGTLIVAALLLPPTGVGAQSLLERPPNVSGNWVGAPGTLHFNFVHRFTASDAPERKVSNVPTFLLAAGLPKRLLAGLTYSTNSTLAPRFPNEWELFARWTPVSEDYEAPLDLGAQVGYNNAASGVDGEVSAAKKFGSVRLILAGRALSGLLEESKVRFAFAGGATLRFGQFIALAGDVASLADRDSTERVGWSAGLHFAIPLTPHTVSLHATNVAVTTLQGASRGSSIVRYGFEFTIPLTLRRYFGRGADPSPDTVPPPVAAAPAPEPLADTTSPPVVTEVPPAPPRDTAPTIAAEVPRVPSRDTASRPVPLTAPPAKPQSVPPASPATVTRPAPRAPGIVRTGMRNINYLRPNLQITVGTTVEWKNNDPLPHTVTAVNRSFDSGLIQPGGTYRRTFTRAGTFNIFCIPHPFMKGVVVVKEQ